MSQSGRWTDASSVPVPRDGTRVELSGSVGDVVQARDVRGGVHFHRRDRPPARAPRHLPGDVRGFVNRSDELSRLDTWLTDEGRERDVIALVVIAGTAGVGKTALALRWAHRARDNFPDGELYVNLRGYDPGLAVTPEHALDRFLRALDIPQSGIPNDPEAKAALYRSLLADRQMLVVLDNAASVGQVRPLLPGTADSLVLVTSRSRLSGLVARDGARRLTLELLSESESVELFQAITADYRANDDPAEIAELARLCARLPLALRIAAERAASRPWMPLTQLIQDLRDESALWDALSAEVGEEADAVRTVFAWSYRALPEGGARMFRLLGLHPGPEFGVSAAAALAELSVSDARHQLDVLVGAHLLEQTTPDRYQFHDLLRAYATDQAHNEESLDDQYAALRRVLTWYLHSAHAAGVAMQRFNRRITPDPAHLAVAPPVFSDFLDGSRWYESEWDNLIASAQAAVKAEMHRIAWQLTLEIRPYFNHSASFEDRLIALGIALDSARRDGSKLGEAEALFSLAGTYSMLDRFEDSVRSHQAALAIRRETRDTSGEAMSLNNLGLSYLRARRFGEAQTHFEQAHTLFRELADVRRESYALFNLGEAYLGFGQVDEAAEVVHRSLEISRETGDRHSESVGLVIMAKVLAGSGEMEEALRAGQDALSIVRDRDDPRNEGWVLLEFGMIQRRAGRFAEALVSYQRATALHRTLADPGREANALDGTGAVLRELGRADEAVDFHRRAVAAHREHNHKWDLATALDNLATALTRTNQSDEAVRCWREAVTLLTDYSDPEATSLAARIQDSMPGP